MAQVLGMPDDRAAIAAASESLRKLFAEAKGEKIVLDVANRIWVQKDKKLEAEFTSLLEGRFGAGAGIVDFVAATEPARVAWIEDRRRAIALALDMAGPADAVLIAGRGHDGYQEMADTIVPFDDRRVARTLLAMRGTRVGG